MQLLNVLWLLTVLFHMFWWGSSTSVPKEAIAEVEASLMSLFGFRKKPNNIDRSKLVIPQAMIDMYERQTGRVLDTTSILRPGLHTKSANTMRSFTHVESPIDARFPGHHRFRLKFDIKTIPNNEKIKAAELTLNRDVVDELINNNHNNNYNNNNNNSDNKTKTNDDYDDTMYYQQVLVSDIIRPGKKGKYEPITRIVDSKLVDIRKSGSVSLDVLPAVERWLEKPSSNHGIIIQIVNYGNSNNKLKKKQIKHLRIKRDVNEDERTWTKKQPLLFTYTDDGKNKQLTGEELAQKRSRRANKNKKRRKESPCKRHPMFVNFSEVGWGSWIVAPPGYDAYYCHGECNFPLAEHLNTTNHAIVQTLVNSMNPSKVPKACCVPTQLSAMSMLYLDDDGKVVLKNYREMTVVGCGCR